MKNVASPIVSVGRPRRVRRLGVVVACVLSLFAALLVVPASTAIAACGGNAIVCENQLPGTPASEWNINGSGDDSIQGFATATSVNAGSRVDFKIKTDARAYTIKIYRLGWYQGNGARLIDEIAPSAPLPQTQPACASDTTTEIYDCGTWDVSASWNVPSSAVSGVYIARLIRKDTGGDSHIPFVVRNDGNTSAAIMQTSDTTWQAYNTYGSGSDFYVGKANGRAYKVSYNRPYATRGASTGRDFLFSNEYPMIRFLEQNGIDVSYVSGLDVATDPTLLPKHKVFLSVGHDEYWTKEQRKNVTDARDAGVNLAFFGGNDVYWKSRLEPSQDGSSTPNRTLVDYKDTWANARLDPVESTATWRDPRFGDLGYGMGPENALTGTIYTTNFDDMAVQVGSDEGKLRIWRGTSLSSMPDGTTVALADHTVGYESNEDLDNGYRPAGLIRMSTTVGPTPEYLLDYGNKTAAGTTTHHITMYRAGSGALVFSAGTVQWAWGLDSNHDGSNPPADPRMRQATLNLLTDMSAPATTRAGDLVATSPSVDTTPPTVTVTSPASGSSIGQGSLVTVTGTATDPGDVASGAAGRVGGVEVSVDGGASFHPAGGTPSAWTYSGILTGSGASAIQVRATDDSLRTSAPVKVAVSSSCPCTLFGVATPAIVDGADTGAVTLGTKFTASQDGFVTGVRFYKSAANTGVHTGTLYSSTGTVLATGAFSNESASGWQTLQFSKNVKVTAGVTYVAGYYAPNGHYSADQNYFLKAFDAGMLKAPSGSNGVYAKGSAFPTGTYKSSNYYIDPLFSLTDTTPTSVSSTSPKSGASSVATTATVSATFSKGVDPATISLQVIDSAQNVVPGKVTYDSAKYVATFTPDQGFSTSTDYTATVAAATLSSPYQWKFTSVAPDAQPNECPCTVFDESDQPTASVIDKPVKLGTAFKAGADGVIRGVRFFKTPEDTATTHTVNLWNNGGTVLAEATSTSESASGWEQVDFASPVKVTAGTTYVVSYTNSTGKYGYTKDGLKTAFTNGPLTTVTTSTVGAGRYTYTTGSAALASTSTTNYFVDPVYTPSPEAKPSVASTVPADGATSVPVDRQLQVRFLGNVQAGSVKMKLVRTSDGQVVAGDVGNESQGPTASFKPTADLAPATKYTLTVIEAKSPLGTKMTDAVSISFTTSGSAACPCSLMDSNARPTSSDSGDNKAVTLGLRFTSTTNGVIRGLRYYRDSTNTGTHTGALYSASGSKLAGLTFTDNGTGWQTANFAFDVPVTAGTTYVASYYAPGGHYAASPGYFSSVVSNTPLKSVGTGSAYVYANAFPTSSFNNTNYYVDVLFYPSDVSPPSVTATNPTDQATNVAASTAVKATFAKDIMPSTLALTVTDAAGNVVTGQQSYDAASRTATFIPGSALLGATTYTAKLSASSAAGVAMTSPKTWNFTTADTQPPVVTTVSPFDGQTGVDASSAVFASFASPVNGSSVLFTVARSDNQAIVSGSTTYDASTRTATFTPSANLAANQVYTVSVSARNTSGVGMGAPKTWTFSTRDDQPPSLATSSPSPDTDNVPVGTKVTAAFARSVKPSSVSIAVTPAGSTTPVAGSVSYDDATATATFTPSSNLSDLTRYTVSVSAQNVSGVPMSAPATWSFTTEDKAAPSVTATIPADGATGVDPKTKVTATFARPVDAGTLSLGLKTAAGDAVTGDAAYDGSSRTVTFTPGADLAAGTTYTATLTARNTSGLAMSSPVNWSFTTPDVPANQRSTAPSPTSTQTQTQTQTSLYRATEPTGAVTDPNGAATTVGVQVVPSRTVTASAIRFYAAAGNTGSKVTLRAADGTVLARATSTDTAAGWRTATFATPVTLTAQTSYTASYLAPIGHWSSTSNAYQGDYTASPLTVPASGGLIGAGDVRPTTTGTTGYWVDVLVIS